MACQQCGKPAIVGVGPDGKVRLCLDCYLKLQQALSNQQAHLASMLNYLTAEMEMMSGMPGLFPRMQVPRPVIHAGQTYHNINVDRSVIGAINTGVVENLDVAMTNIRVGGDEQLADALRRMTEAVIQSTDLVTGQKNDALDHLAVIAEQAAKPKEQRSIGALKTIIQAFERIVRNSAALLALWQQFGPRILDLLK